MFQKHCQELGVNFLLGNADLRLEEEAAVEIQLGSALPLQRGLEMHHGCRCFLCSRLLPFARRKLLRVLLRAWPCDAVPLPAEGLPGRLGEDNSTTHLIPGEEQLWCMPCAKLPCQHGGQARWNGAERSEEARQECHLVSGCTENCMLAICFTFCWQSWCEKQHSLIRQCQDT